ncbi:MAG: hypothetical protein LQ351_004292 [Letrouitia transgressa]|nr:MAG: hypothetical protein LQ351_004292 [Letrouitia transgressa]
MDSREILLTPVDLTMPRRYFSLLIYFSLSNPDNDSIASKLKSSFQRTLEALPILTGTVQPAHKSDQRGSLCVGAPWNTADDLFRIKDMTSSDLEYESLRRKHFPMAISEHYDLFSILTSRPNPFGLENPVMMAQVNFIRNGMILVPFLHHSVMDGLGGATVVNLWANFCRGETRAEVIREAMMGRERLMVGDETGRWEDFWEYVNVSESHDNGRKPSIGRSGIESLRRGCGLPVYAFSSLIAFVRDRFPRLLLPATKPKHASPIPQSPKEIDTEIFFIPHSKLATLQRVLSPSTNDYISTNDALSALLFTCVTQVRKIIHPNFTQLTIPFALAVSGRRLLSPPLAEHYIGNVSLLCHLDVALDRVTANPQITSITASHIRQQLRQIDSDYIMRLIGALRKVDDISKIAPASRASENWSFIVTSWTAQKYYSMDWGPEIGAKCERVRVPKLSSPVYEGVNVVLPELRVDSGTDEGEEAGLEVMVGLERRAMGRLKDMTEWAQWRCS